MTLRRSCRFRQRKKLFFRDIDELVIGQMQEGPQYFPEDQITDHPEYFIVSELVREKVLFAH